MAHRGLPFAAAGLLVGAMLVGCGGSQETPVVGNPENIVIEDQGVDDAEAADSGDDDLMVEVKATDLPDSWPTDFPLPQGAAIDNVIESGDSVTVTWILPGGSIPGITQDFSNALIEAGFEYGQSEGSDEVGQGTFNNEDYQVDFTITSIDADQLQLYLVYGPFAE